MHHFVSVLLVGLCAGAGSGWAASKITARSGDAPGDTAMAGQVRARFQALEDQMRERFAMQRAQTMPMLSPDERTQPAIDEAALIERIRGSLEQDIAARIETAFTKHKQDTPPFLADMEQMSKLIEEMPEDLPNRKKAPLSEIAAELGLTGAEEDGLRTLENKLFADVMDLVLEEGETVESLAADLASLQGDKEELGKYEHKMIMRLASKAPQMMSFVQKRMKAGSDLLGRERWIQYDTGYKATDLDSSVLSGLFDDK